MLENPGDVDAGVDVGGKKVAGGEGEAEVGGIGNRNGDGDGDGDGRIRSSGAGEGGKSGKTEDSITAGMDRPSPEEAEAVGIPFERVLVTDYTENNPNPPQPSISPTEEIDPLELNADHFSIPIPDTASVINFGPEPVPIPTSLTDTTTDLDSEADSDDTTPNEDDLETPKASVFLTRHGIPSVGSGGAGEALTPRLGMSRANSSLSIQEDHFHNPLAAALQAVGSGSSNTRLQSTHTQHNQSSTAGLASQPTTAISLPEGVLAQHQQPPDANRITSSRGTSITGAPSFSSDVASVVPTLDGRGNDVEGMLGEILSMDNAGARWWGDQSSAASGLHWNIAAGDLIPDANEEGEQSTWAQDDDEESSDEERDKGMPDGARISRWRGRRKHFFILSGAGKPVYSSHGNGSGTEQMLVSGYMGVIQTIISFFNDSGGGSGGPGDALKSFVAGKCRFVVLKEVGPLYLVAVSRLACENEAQLRAQLEKLYSQVVATLTVSALTRVFSQREGFDLRRLLGGTEVFLDGLSDAMTRGDPGTLLSALECVRLRKRERERVHAALLKGRSEKLLYGMVVADGRLVGVVRPRRHSLHPMDLQVVFGMLFNASTFRDSGARGDGVPAGAAGVVGGEEGGVGGRAGESTGGEHWIPVCLPKFNGTGYLYAYIHFWRRELAIVLISAEHDAFFELRAMKEAVVAKLDSPDPKVTSKSKSSSTSNISTSTTSTTSASLTSLIESALSSNRYSLDEVLAPHPSHPSHTPHSPRILHFLYKSRRNVQFTMPSWEPHFPSPRSRRRVMSIYQNLHAKVHRPGGAGVKVFFERVGGWLVLAWVGGGWEVYVVAQGSGGGRGSVWGVSEEERRGLAEGTEMIIRWVAREEERVFVVGEAVF